MPAFCLVDKYVIEVCLSLTAHIITYLETKMQIQDKMDQLATSLKELLTDHKTFDGDIVGKGFVWADGGPTKQFLFTVKPDRFLSTEHLDIGKDKAYHINGERILDSLALGDSVTKSNLQELGHLNGLIVNGPVSIDQFIYFDSATDKLGIGTETPNARVSIVDNNVETVLGGGYIGTYTNDSFSIVTNNQTKIKVSETGDIDLGNSNSNPVQVTVHGTLSVNVSNPEPGIDLQVAGAVKFEGKTHRYNVAPPISGFHNVGDIVWNSQPRLEHYVGWVCIVSGNPGRWEPFGKIGNQ